MKKYNFQQDYTPPNGYVNHLRHLAFFLFLGCLLIELVLARGISYAGKQWISYTTEDGLSSNIVKCITVDGDEVWIGTNNGVSRFNKKKNRWTIYTTETGLTSNQVNAILVDGDEVWFGTEVGVTLFNRAKNTWISYTTKEGLINDRVNALAVTDSEVWLGTEGGLSAFNKTTGSFTSYTTEDGLFDKRIKSLLVDGGYLLITTVGPVISALDMVRKEWAFYSPEELLYTNVTIASEGGIIWVGTNGGGVRAYDKITKRWTYYISPGRYPARLARKERVVSGLVDNFLQSIAADGRYIWFGTFDGVSRLDIIENKWRTFTTKDGLIDDSVTAIAIDGNYVWFGTDDGISRFNKIIPQADIYLSQSYLTEVDKPLEIKCRALSYRGIKDYVMEYSIGSFPEVWLKRGIDILRGDKKGSLVVKWDLKDLPSTNDVYNFRLTVRDKKEKFNRSLARLVVDTIEPVVSIDVSTAPFSVGLQTITGKFNKGNVEKIVVQPGNISASLNFSDRTFAALVFLEEGSNKVEATVIDWLGRSAKAEAIVEARAASEKPAVLAKKEEGVPSGRQIIRESLLFNSGSARIVSEGFPILEKVINILQQEPKVEITIEGHTDNVPIGPKCLYPTNLVLSKARANEVFQYLMEKTGIPIERFTLKGYGDSKPVASNETAKGRAMNRRVEIVVNKIE